MRKSIIMLLGAIFVLTASIRASGQAIDIGNRKQLFIDERFIEQGKGVELCQNPPVKCGIVVSGDNSWENGFLQSDAVVIEDGGKYRMWYTACPASDLTLAPYNLCYAESSDGVHWIKPNLGLFEWEGSKANNIIMGGNIGGGSVFLDPKGLPDQRYKLLTILSNRIVRAPGRDPELNNAPDGPGLYFFTSPDGIKWKLQPKRVFPFSPDTTNMVIYDDRTDKYLAYVRTWNPLRRVGVVEMTDPLQPWPYDKTVPPRAMGHQLFANDIHVPANEIGEAFGPGPGDPANVDFYTSSVVKYPWAEDVYFMFPSAYRHFPEPPKNRFHNDGVLDIQMAVSRDGRKFHRVSRFPYIGLGMKGSKDGGSMYMGIGMIRRSNEIYQYYGGYAFTHGGYMGLPEIRNQGGVLLTRQRLDGFVSVDASEKGGQFVTPPVVFKGRQLALNLDASATGEVRVELRDADGRPIAGYSFEDCNIIGLNDTAAVVTWGGNNTDVSKLAGKPIRIAFKMRTAKLYAFRFGD